MLVSLVAVIVGLFVTFAVAKRQIVSPIRQKWIDELRELMSELISECQRAIILGENRGLLNEEKTDEALFRKLLYLEQKLKLMLNPNEDKHIELMKIVRDITDAAHHGIGDLIGFGICVDHATQVTQTILKSEWVRVKSGKV